MRKGGCQEGPAEYRVSPAHVVLLRSFEPVEIYLLSALGQIMPAEREVVVHQSEQTGSALGLVGGFVRHVAVTQLTSLT